MNKGLGMFEYLSKIRLALYAIVFGTLISGLVLAQTTGTGGASTLQSVLCNIIGAIASIIGVLAIFMFVIGGVLYAFAHFMPAAGNLKGSMQGWGMGVLMGGIIMIILYVLAPYIVGIILGFSLGGGANGVSLPSVGAASCS